MYSNRESIARMLARGKDSAFSYFRSHYQSPSVRLHWKHYLRDGIIVVALVGALAMMFRAGAATYTFVQGSWVGGATVNKANHASNRTGWTQFESASGLVSGSSLSLSFTASSITDASTMLTRPATPNFSPGAATAPADVEFSSDGNFAYIANSGSSTLTMVSRNLSTGVLTALSPATINTGTDPVAIALSPDGTSVYTTNRTGNTVSMYSRNTTTGLLTALSPATIIASSSPQEIVPSPDNAFVYVLSAGQNVINMYSRNVTTGALTPLATPTIATGVTPFGLVISPDGAFVYAANSSAATVSMYSRNVTTGQLTALSPATVSTGGAGASKMVISPDGLNVYVNLQSEVAALTRNPSTGLLTLLGRVSAGVASGVTGMAISPDGSAVYALGPNGGPSGIFSFKRNASTGALTAFPTPFIAASTTPFGIGVSPDSSTVYVTAVNDNIVNIYKRGNSVGSPSFEAGTLQNTRVISGIVTLSGTGGDSGAIMSTITGFSTPYEIVYDPTQKAIWVANSNGSSLTRVNASSGTTTTGLAAIAAPKWLTYHQGTNSIWNASNGNSFTQKVNASTGAQSGSFFLGSNNGLVAAPDSVWVSISGKTFKFDPANGNVLASSTVLTTINPPVYDSTQNAIWLMAGSSVQKIDVTSFTLTGTYPVSDARKGAHDPVQNAIWAIGQATIAGTNTGILTRINAATGAAVSTTTINTGNNLPDYVAYDSGHNAVWVTSPLNNSVIKVNAATGAVIATYTTGFSTPRGIAYDPENDFVWIANAGGNSIVKVGSGLAYDPSGTFTSGVIDIGSVAALTTVTYSASVAAGQTVSIDVRAGNTPTPDGTWSGWVTGLSSGGDISSLTGRYAQYRINLTTNNSLVSPSVSSVTLNYNAYGTSGTLISSPFDSGSPANLLSSVSWTATQPTGTQVKFQLRSAPDNGGAPGTWTSWMGPDGTSGSFFTSSDGSESMPAALKDATNDQWLQYKAILTQSSGVTPTLTGVTVTYVVNDPPQFDLSFGGTGVTASQIATSTDSNLGKVYVQYKVRDTDSTTGSLTPGFITPSFEYDIGGGWVAVPSQNLSSGALANKAVNESAFSLYEAYVDIAPLLPNTYTTNAKIRVKINDNEGANNLAFGTSTSFVLDTKAPVISSMHIDGASATSTVTFSANDDTPIQGYILSNNADFSPDGVNLTSGIEQPVLTTSANIAVPWTLSSGATKTVYVKVLDMRGNTSTRNVVVSATPSNMEFRDISNPELNSYREFLAWNVYPEPAPAGAPFGSYQLYKSTDGTNYSLLFTSTNPATNYYIDTPLATSTMYSYKVVFITANGDRTQFSRVVSDEADGKGGTNNGALPLISAVAAPEVKNTSAKITWTTDDLALSEVDFGTSNSYGRVATSRSYVTDHVVYLTGLTPNTQYFYRVRSIDAFSVSATDSNNGNGYTFTTGGGPVISGVTVPSINDTSAEVSWKTNLPADSYVYFSTSPALESATQMGSSDLVQSPFQHSVVLTGLTTDTLYYYKITSTDADGNTTVDDNNGAYYSLRTTNDTKAPIISDVVVPVKASNGAVITWKTDELSSSKVEYGTESAASSSYTFSTDEITTPTIFHAITLSPETAKQGGGTNELSKKTKYYFRVKSTDPAGNTTYSAEGDFMTTEDGAVNLVGGGYAADTPADKDKDTTRPTISDVKIVDVGPFSATVTFATDEDTRAIIQYGTSAEYGSSAGSPTLAQTHKVAIRGLKMGTKYHFAVNAVDKAGNISISADQEFQTTNLAEDLGKLAKLEQGMDSLQEQIENLIESALPSVNPPFIEKPTIEEIGEDFARISWRTNVKAYGSITYAEDAEYAKTGQYGTEQSKTDAKTIDHAIDLSNLKPNTKYHFKVKSYVFIGADSQSDDMTFTTRAGRVQPQVQDRKKDSMRVVWNTPVPTNSIVSYKVRGSQFASRKQDDGMTTSHEVLLDNLAPKTTYEIRVSGTTPDGNTIEGKDTIIASTNEDVTPPTISNFKVDSALVPGRNDRTQTIVSWKTDEPATSVVYYDEGPGSATAELSQMKDNGKSYTDTHVIILTSLKPGTIYRFQIISVDDANNTSKLPVRTIVTPSQSESIVDVIFKNFDDTFKFMKSVR